MIFRWVFIVLCFLSLNAEAQTKYSSHSKKAIKNYEEAQLLLRQRKFPEAIHKLNVAVVKDPDFIEAHLRLAFSYELLRNLEGQQYHLEQVVRIAPKSMKYKNVYYSLGKVYFNQGQYKKSMDMLLRLEQLGIDNPRMQAEVTKLNENISFALKSIQNPLDIHPVPLPAIVNAFPLQYFPVLTADENTIVFTTREGLTFADDENIVVSEKDVSGNWSPPVSISPNINSTFNEGTCTISADGRTLIFTSCEGRKSYGGCDLYISRKTGKEWSVPKNLGPEVNSRSWDSQPALSADGRMLFFVSTRGGGIGRKDLWKTELGMDGRWRKAINLGASVNTKEDEVSPFLHVNGTTLYFASQGYPGMGGFDLYQTEWKDSTWTTPKNLGYPINTFEDQVSLFVSTNGEKGYYSYEKKDASGRERSLLYKFAFPAESQISNKAIYLTGNIYDQATHQPLGASIKIYRLGEDQPTAVFIADTETGKYYCVLNENQQISLYVEHKGYLFKSESFKISPDSANAMHKDIFMEPIQKGSTVRLNNIFFDLNSAKLNAQSRTELVKMVELLSENPTISITISGHTDDQGTTDYNMKLSEQRAKAVYDFLINLGIAPARLTYKGYGESRPLQEGNDEKSRRINRRIEFSVN